MGLRVNTNLASISALRNLRQADVAQRELVFRLSPSSPSPQTQEARTVPEMRIRPAGVEGAVSGVQHIVR